MTDIEERLREWERAELAALGCESYETTLVGEAADEIARLKGVVIKLQKERREQKAEIRCLRDMRDERLMLDQQEIERLQAALDDEMQAHCICVEARDNAILEADRLRKEVKWLRDLLRKEPLKRLDTARSGPSDPSVE